MVRRINRNPPAIQVRRRRGFLSGIGDVVKSAVSDLPSPLKNIIKGNDGGNAIPKGTKGGKESTKPPPKTPPPKTPPPKTPPPKTPLPTTPPPTTPPISRSGSAPPEKTSSPVGNANNGDGSNIPQQSATTQLTITPISSGTIDHDSTTIPTLGGMVSEGKSTSTTSGSSAEDNLKSQSPSLKTSTTIFTKTGTDGHTSTYTSTIVLPSEHPTFVSEHRNQLTAGPIVGIVIIVLGILTCAIIILVWVMKRRRRIRFMYQEETTQMTSNAILLTDQGSDRWSYATTESQFSIGLDRNGSYSANSVGPSDERLPMTQYGSEQHISVIPSYKGLQQRHYHCPITAGSTANLDDPFITPPTSPRLTAMESSSLPTTPRSEHLEAKAAMAEIVETLSVHKRELREEVGGRLIGSPSSSEEPV